eukprot:2126698-Rhodomonas_salina.4
MARGKEGSQKMRCMEVENTWRFSGKESGRGRGWKRAGEKGMERVNEGGLTREGVKREGGRGRVGANRKGEGKRK